MIEQENERLKDELSTLRKDFDKLQGMYVETNANCATFERLELIKRDERVRELEQQNESLRSSLEIATAARQSFIKVVNEERDRADMKILGLRQQIALIQEHHRNMVDEHYGEVGQYSLYCDSEPVCLAILSGLQRIAPQHNGIIGEEVLEELKEELRVLLARVRTRDVDPNVIEPVKTVAMLAG